MTSSWPDLAPVLETERLRLRLQTPDDIEAAHAFWAREDVYRHIDGKPRAREDVWRRILSNAGTWALFGFGSWTVERRDTGAFVGGFGFLEAQRDMIPTFRPGEVETGWSLAPEAQGKGYGSEALGAMFAWFDVAHPDKTAVCIINHENTPSLKLAARVGFVRRAEASYHDHKVIQFERVKR